MANDAGSNQAALRVMASKALSQNGVTQTPESLAAMISQMQQAPGGGPDFDMDTMKPNAVTPPDLEGNINPLALPPAGNGSQAGRQLISTPPGATQGGSTGGSAGPTQVDGPPMLRPNMGQPSAGPQLNANPLLAAVQKNIAQRGVRGYTPDANNDATATQGIHPVAMGLTGAALPLLPDMIMEGLPALLRGMLPRAFGGATETGAGETAGAAGAADAGEGASVGADGATGGADATAEGNAGMSDAAPGGSNTEAAMREIVNNPTPENVAQVAKQWPEDVQALIDEGHLEPEMYSDLGMKPALDSPGYKAWRLFRTQMGRGGKGSATPDYLDQLVQ